MAEFSIAILPLGSEGSKVAGNLLEMLIYFFFKGGKWPTMPEYDSISGFFPMYLQRHVPK